MTDIERKALALLNEVRREENLLDADLAYMKRHYCFTALCRAIEQHEAFRREVSDAVEAYLGAAIPLASHDGRLRQFIIPKPVDPLVEALKSWGNHLDGEAGAAHIRAAMQARGYQFTKIGEGA